MSVIDHPGHLVAYGVTEWAGYFTNILAGSPGRTYTVRTDGAAWRVRTGPALFAVEDGAGDEAADVTVSGPPTAVLHWVWKALSRQGDGRLEAETRARGRWSLWLRCASLR